MSTPKILTEPPCYLKNHSPKSLGRIRAISNKTHVLRGGIISEVYTYGQRGELLSISKEENRDRLDAGLFPQQRSPGGDSFIQYLLNSDPGEVTLKADIMKLVSDKSKVYPELFDPALSSAYYFSPDEGALNQFRTLKNSGDAEVLAVWKEIAPPGTQRVHFCGCQWSEYYQYDSAGNRVSIQNGWGMIESRYGRENQLIQRGQRHFDYDGNGNLIQERMERSTADYSYNARNRMKGVQMSRRGTVGLAGFESGSNALSYTYDALGCRQSRTTSAGEHTLYRYGDFGLNPMEERTQIGTIPMQLESDLRVDALVTDLTKFNFENRDANNINLSSKDEIGNQPEWRHEYKGAFHQNGETRDEKWVNDLDGREVVYDGDTGQILTDQYHGTYNYINVAPNPKKWYDAGEWLKVGGTMVGHGVMDVAPWYILGIDRKE